MRHLFNHWSQVSGRLRSAPKIALFLDFDGTLAPLQSKPDQVSLEGSMRHALAALARNPRFRIWVISGRRREDVRARIRVPGVQYLGLHGWEGRGGELAEDARHILQCLLSRIERAFADSPGLWIEDKEYALTLHHGGIGPADLPRARAILEGIIEPFSERFRIQCGKNVWEVLPRELEDKGQAVKQELVPLRGRSVAMFVGDDQVDEPAFSALPGGITVRVGPPCRTHARFRLCDVAEVRMLLHRLRTEFALALPAKIRRLN